MPLPITEPNVQPPVAGRSLRQRGLAALLLLLPAVAAIWLLHSPAAPVFSGLSSWIGLANADVRAGESLRLGDYQVAIEAQVIAGLASDVSGLTYDPDRRTLFAITNKRPEIVELSLQGDVLRRIPVAGLDDPEAIEYIGPGHYVVADERTQTLVEIRIDEATQQIDTAASRKFSIGMGRNGNRGFEGLAYDRQGDRLFVAKERNPLRIYEVTGFPTLAGEGARPLEIADNPQRDAALPVRDLSSLYYDAGSGNLLVLSDESQVVLEVDRQGRRLARLALKKGRHGLQRSVPQAEGMAMDEAGNLYLVSEPNLFYLFRRDE
ncbi:MAG: DNA-binding protein [Betaproteobacteria bacterium HGW-Betaproteobacteria-12]|nr:MAG: DNA-binding protein [Betaproteobacteria bacterium HGW-Betaproteobacteria-12]